MPKEPQENRIAKALKTARSWSMLWSIDDLLQEIINSTILFLHADYAALLLLDDSGLKEKIKQQKENYQYHPNYMETAERVIKNGSAIYTHILAKGNAHGKQICCVPLTANQGILGTIYIEKHDAQNNISAEDKLLIEMLALQAASFIENSILYHSAITDPLTGLFSHRHFIQECDQILRRAIRTQLGVTLMIIDIDHFKNLNDQFGHEEGNRCLRRISELLKQNFRATDIIARFGGDEFEILLPEATPEKALEIAESLIKTIRNEDFPIPLSATIGIANFPKHAQDSQSLFLSADQALYQGKKEGRNCVRITTTTVHTNNVHPQEQSNTYELLNVKPQPSSAHAKSQSFEGLEVLQQIAVSENNEILLAKQLALDRVVALKQPLSEHLTAEHLAAFKKEALLTASLSHPGVVPLYTMGQGADGRLYYTMKPLKGLSLEELLKRWKAKDNQIIVEYNFVKLINILFKASETITYAHNKNTIHLDIHPGNIIVGEFGEITIIDWGKGTKLTEEVSTKPLNQHISGSLVYKAPEQLHTGMIGKFTDVYSLGIILLEILTCKNIFLKGLSHHSLNAIFDNTDLLSEQNEIFQSTDPILVYACQQALNQDYTKRISVSDFSARLSRFVLQETDTTTHKFNNNTSLQDWYHVNIPIKNKTGWHCKNGVFTPAKDTQENLLFWKPLVTRNFIFSCEAWIEEPHREISLYCFGKITNNTTAHKDLNEEYQGYCFQFGADDGQYTKLARHAIDIMVNKTYVPELNKKYILTISYQDGKLTCFIDRDLIFSYRELFPFKGSYIGLYTYYSGAHFRPLEIKYEQISLRTPVIRLADELLANSDYEIALERYHNIAETFPDRMDGISAQFKKGYCHAKLGNKKEAVEIFKTLYNTPLEPYASVEMAILELPENDSEVFRKKGDYIKAATILKSVAERFPYHQALQRIFDIYIFIRDRHLHNAILYKKNMQSILEAKIDLFRIGLNTSNIPAHSQLRCLDDIVCHLIFVGKQDEALKLCRFFFQQHPYKYNTTSIIFDHILLLYYCQDQWKSLPQDVKNRPIKHWIQDICPIVLVEKFTFDHDLLLSFQTSTAFRVLTTHFILQLALKEKPTFTVCLAFLIQTERIRRKFIYSLRNTDHYSFEMLISADAENSYAPEIFTFFEAFLADGQTIVKEAVQQIEYYKCFMYITQRNYLQATEALNKIVHTTSSKFNLQEKKILLACLLHSIGYQTNYPCSKLKEDCHLHLSGVRLELCLNLLEKDFFTFSNIWPIKPSFCFYDRLIYCIWAIEKNFIDQAESVLQTLINPKLGNAYFQNFLIRLATAAKEKRYNSKKEQS